MSSAALSPPHSFSPPSQGASQRPDPQLPWGYTGNLFLLFTSCLPTRFDSTTGFPCSRHCCSFPGCLLPPHTKQPLAAMQDARGSVLPQVQAPASHCLVTVSARKPVAGHHRCAEPLC